MNSKDEQNGQNDTIPNIVSPVNRSVKLLVHIDPHPISIKVGKKSIQITDTLL